MPSGMRDSGRQQLLILKDKKPLAGAMGQPPERAESAAPAAAESTENAALNTADGLKRIGGDESIYRLVLGAFAEENQTVGAELKRAVEGKQFEQAVQIVHKIKSSCGSIGANGLHDTAAELQKALQDREERTTARLHELFQIQLTQLLLEIHDYLAN